MIKIIEKVFAVILICLISYLSITIYRSILKQNQPPVKGKPYIPFMSSSKKICSQEKVSCDPNDAGNCQKMCGDSQQISCVKVNDEHLCLPKSPDIHCNKENGGRYVWTGYGMTQQKEWACLCTKPEIYGGPHCETRNPSFCSGGDLSNDLNNTLGDLCRCREDKNRGLLYRVGSNDPICVSKNSADGGGEDGLYGNYRDRPDWRNVFYQFRTKNDWATAIAKEFNYGNKDAIKKILEDAIPPPQPTFSSSISTFKSGHGVCAVKKGTNVPEDLCTTIHYKDRNGWEEQPMPETPSPSPIITQPPTVYMLNKSIVDKIKSLPGFNDISKTPFDENYRIVDLYRYFTNTYMA
jgi:hypothetical protein